MPFYKISKLSKQKDEKNEMPFYGLAGRVFAKASEQNDDSD
jgi:hypothetical protein